jgi:hypothetical protein
MSTDAVSPVPDAPGWSYGAFAHDREAGTVHVPLVNDGGGSTAFTVPDFLNDPEDLGRIAQIVIGAVDKWQEVEGLGA